MVSPIKSAPKEHHDQSVSVILCREAREEEGRWGEEGEREARRGRETRGGEHCGQAGGGGGGGRGGGEEHH